MMKDNANIIQCRFTYRGRPEKVTHTPPLLLRAVIGLYVPTRLLCGTDMDQVEILRRSDIPGAYHEKPQYMLQRKASKTDHTWITGETIALAAFPESLEKAWAEDALPLSDLVQVLDIALCAQNIDLDEVMEKDEEQILLEILDQLAITPSDKTCLTREETRLLVLLMYVNAARQASGLIFSSLQREITNGSSREFIRRFAKYGEEICDSKMLDPAGLFFALCPGLESLPWLFDDEEEGDKDLPF